MKAGEKMMPYFFHDSTAHEDVKCRMLMIEHGVEGYGRWWLLCEALAFCDKHRLPCKGSGLTLLAESLRCSADECKAFLDTCAEVGLIEPDLYAAGFVVSDRMLRNSMLFGRNRVNGAKGGRPRKEKIA